MSAAFDVNKCRSKSASARYSRSKFTNTQMDRVCSALSLETTQPRNQSDAKINNWINSIHRRALRSELKTFVYNIESFPVLQHDPSNNESNLALNLNDCCRVLDNELSSHSYKQRGKETSILIQNTMMEKTSYPRNFQRELPKDTRNVRLILPESRTGQTFRILQQTYKNNDISSNETEDGGQQNESDSLAKAQNSAEIDTIQKSLSGDCVTRKTSSENSLDRRNTTVNASGRSYRNKIMGQMTNKVSNVDLNSKKPRASQFSSSTINFLPKCQALNRNLSNSQKSLSKDESGGTQSQTMRNIVKSALWRSYKGTRYPPPVFVRKFTL